MAEEIRIVIKEEPKIEADSIPTGTSLGFVHCLTNAEIFYFEKRDLDRALAWCQKAIEIADDNMPSWVSKSDALYLLARIFERKDMPLDADYYYSLILDFENYDQWRIYGNPGRVLRNFGHSPTLNRGKLSLTDNDITNIMNRITQGFPHGVTDDAEILDLIRAIYADDVSWSGKEIKWKIPSYQDAVFIGPFTHLLATAGPLEYLRIALHNPWVDVKE